jgi:ATP-binding protein involved in chromosome partitioning
LKDIMPSELQLQESLRDIVVPGLGRSLGALDMLRGAELTGEETATIRVELPTPAFPDRDQLAALIRTAVQIQWPQVKNVDVRYFAVVKGKMTGGAIGLKVKNVIAVGSGKGGVGKSTVAAALAYGLKTLGCKVGLMDADVYGPSIPHMVGSHGVPAVFKVPTPDGQTVDRLQPVEADGVKVMSMAYFVKPDQAVIWRGPLLHRAITQFLSDTDWGELDYLIIDLPPGTGDVSLTLSQLLGLAGAVVVCTPQQVALLDAVKAISMFRQVNIPVLGIVENMTGAIFGRGGAQQKARELGLPFLGEIPIEAQIRIRGDEGRIASLFADDCPAKPYLLNVCQQVALQIAKSLLETPSLPTLEIL